MSTTNEQLEFLTLHHRRVAALRGRLVLVKVGGSIQDDSAQMRRVMTDVAALASLGARPVVVHGGGKAINAALASAGLGSRFVQGQRYTDARTLEIAEGVLIERVNAELVAMIAQAGAEATGLHSRGACVLAAQRQGTDAAPGQPSEDLGLVGRVCRVQSAVIEGLAVAGVVPVIAPIALDETGLGKLNVNADLAAGAVAAAVHARVFILVSDTTGVRTDPEQPGSHAPVLSRFEARGLQERGVIAGGMLPKLAACFMGLDGGAERVAIIDGRVARSLLRAVLADPPEPIDGTWVTG
ncbi:MAG: acetylglutamate kinase [Phycisphaerales bacterium]